jgi:Flp pilus assembly protein TadG
MRFRFSAERTAASNFISRGPAMRLPSFRQFRADRRANVTMMFGLLMVPLIFSVGMGIDYGASQQLHSKLNAAADAAALAAVTPTAMAGTTAAAKQAAINMFEAQVAGLPRLIFSPTDLTVTVNSPSALTRTVVVSYTAQSRNVFGGILHMATIPLSGSSTANTANPPNIDFYLLLDSSPSMGIAGTQADIATMVAATSSIPGYVKQGPTGCAFACHEVNPAADNLGNPHGEDNYALARILGVTLRTDLLDTAVTGLTNLAYAKQSNVPAAVKPTYRMSINSFDVGLHSLVPLTTNYVSAWATQLSAMKANNTQFMEVYGNNNLCTPTSTTVKKVTTTDPCGAGTANSDADTNYDAAMSGITSLMPMPGNGTNKAGDTPQEILFLVTDGVEDETTASGARQQSTMVGTKDWCTPLKNKGIQIAVLYTEYFPLIDSWYQTYIAPFQPSIGTTLQNCASPTLYYEVQMGGDISDALAKLFLLASATAHLTN